jgi:5-methylcytosine-specific restriction endonuclease McrA
VSDHDSTTGKVCRDCRICKPLADFSPNKYSKDRINYICKICASARSKAYAAANKEKVSEKKKAARLRPDVKAKEAAAFKAYKEKNKDQLRRKRIAKYHSMTADDLDRKRTSNRAYWIRNRDAIAARRNARVSTPEEGAQKKLRLREWYKANRENLRMKSALYYQENRDRVLANVRNYVRANPDKVRLLGRVKAHRRRIRLDAAGGENYTRQDIERIYKLQRGCCAACKKKLNGKYHIDHRMPVAKGGNNTKENIDLLCPPCNQRKSAKLPHVFAQENGMLI